jgi:hypothetical protein
MSSRGIRLAAAVAGVAALAGCGPQPSIDSVTVSNSQPVVGESVEFAVIADRSLNDSSMWMEWDFDGDGTFESAPTFFSSDGSSVSGSAFKSYATPGPVRPSVVVFERDNHTFTSFLSRGGAQRELALTVSPSPTSPPVSNQAPTASFQASPNPADVERPVTFDASQSSDAGGTIVRYEWDIDGNGTFERNTGSTPTTTHTYTTSGTYRVGVRVTDNGGASSTFHRDLVVRAHLPEATQAAISRPGFADGLPRFSIAIRGVPVRDGVTRINAGVLSVTDMLLRGRTRFLDAGPLPRTVARYALAHELVGPTDGSSLDVRGVLLVRFRPGRTACFQLVAAGSSDGPIRASLRVLGGSGALTRLRGSGAITRIPTTGSKITAPGRGRFALGDEAQRLPRACRALNRELRG